MEKTLEPNSNMAQDNEQKYINYNPFDGDRDTDVKCRTVKMVTTKKPRKCFGWPYLKEGHMIPAGTRARHERAIVDGTWASYYECVECMDAWFKECAGD